ncbi:MAG: methionine--tRNA ligase [Armatimonadota bacterium]
MKFYITTPIYYVNAEPTVGNAYSTIACDVLARYHRLRGDDVLFTTGTDEHAVRVLRLAEEKGIQPKAYADQLAARFTEEWRRLDIAYDDFIRTTEHRQYRAVQQFFETIYRNGDLYLGSYEGWYCVPDETFFREEELVDGRCPNPECGRPVEWVSEPAYFFRFSKYADRLLQQIEADPDWLIPDFRRNEAVSFIRGGLRDVSITRRSTWGIPLPPSLPRSEGLVIYVWADALVNYLTCAGYPDDAGRFAHYWPADVHLMAKDIFTRFHATMWPAMLMSAGLPLPGKVAAHGYWTVGGEKISKSRSAQPPRPEPVLARVIAETGCTPERAVDALRYYELREMTFGQDADFSVEGLLRRYSDDLANDLGNLLNRVLPMVARYRQGRLPKPCPSEPELCSAAKQAAAAWEQCADRLDFRGGLEAIWAFLGVVNRYVDQRAPWALAKAGDDAALDRVLYSATEAIRIAACLVSPVMPSTANEIERQLGLVGWQRKWEQASQWGLLPAGQVIGEPRPLFPRLQTATQLRGPEPDSSTPLGPVASAKGARLLGSSRKDGAMVSFSDFKKIELRVGEVLTAEPVPGADKLLKLTVDIGGEQRTMVAGVALSYRPEQLIGKQVVVVANLEPATIRGVRSEGMILAGWVKGDDKSISIVTPDRPLPKGSTVS